VETVLVSISVPEAGTKTHDAVFQVGDWKNEGFHLQILAISDPINLKRSQGCRFNEQKQMCDEDVHLVWKLLF